MAAVMGAKISQLINASLVDLFWRGSPVAVTALTTVRDEIRGSVGSGPLARTHFKKINSASISVDTFIPVSFSPDAIGCKTDSFNMLDYLVGKMDSSGVVLSQANKTMLRKFSVSIAPERSVVASFSSDIMEPTRTVVDFIKEIAQPEPGNGKNLIPYENVALFPIFKGQPFGGVASLEISTSIDLRPIPCPGGIYGYFFGHPFSVDVSAEIYEKFFLDYQEIFMDVQGLGDLEVGPFRVSSLKMTNHSTSVDARGYKIHSVKMTGSNFAYKA